MENNEITVTKKVYFDKYEKENGDGFYPQLTPLDNWSHTLITFKLITFNNRKGWVQISNSVIYGFDGINGVILLATLNEEASSDASVIINSGGRIIYPTTDNTTYRILKKKDENRFIYNL